MDKFIFLQSNQGIVFSTREFAVACDFNLSHAVRTLNKLAEANAITKVTKGIWANSGHPFFTPYSAIPLLLKNEQGHLSFLSVLHREGVISQIPHSIQIATTGRTRKLVSPIATFEFFHLNSRMFTDGIGWSSTKAPYLQATVEKALLDTFYLSTRKSNRFQKLPELDISELKEKKFEVLLAKQVKNKRLYNHILTRWQGHPRKVLNFTTAKINDFEVF